eukprot:TRINITY_DN97_c0_g1_i2.p1 TRINITY_DN97_c0_g1~~TRINITY_DN97_c0_g1_i2.p1  ORF type:complete len:901 (-),score=257.41 TRINITY_DN97_c0_g1_i2:214-2916(-)
MSVARNTLAVTLCVLVTLSVAHGADYGLSSGWVRLAGRFKQIVTAGKSSIYALPLREAGVAHFESGTWKLVDRLPLTSLAVSCRGDQLWGVDKDGYVVHRKKDADTNKFEWVRTTTSSKKYASVALGADENALFAIDTTNNLYQYHLANKTWIPSNGAKLKQVRVQCTPEQKSGDVWGITGEENLWKKLNDGSWREVAQSIKDVTVGKSMYVVDNKYRLYQYTPRKPGQAASGKPFQSLYRTFRTCGAANDGTLMCLGRAGHVYRYEGVRTADDLGMEARAALEKRQGGKWVPIPGGEQMARVTAGERGVVYGVTKTGAVKRYVRPRLIVGQKNSTAAKWVTIRTPEPMSHVSVGCDGTLWGVTAEMHTYEYKGKHQWNRITESLLDVSVGTSKNEIWGVNDREQVVLFNQATRSFQVQKGLLKSVAAGCDSTVWGISRDAHGSLWTRTRTLSTWKWKGRYAKRVAVGGDATYIIDNRNFLYQYRPPRAGYPEGRRSWKPLFKLLVDIAAGDDGAIYGVDLKGRTVRFQPHAGRDTTGATWTQVPGRLRDLCVADKDNIVGLVGRTPVRWSHSRRTWAVVPGVKLNRIDCSCDGSVWGVRTLGKVYRWQDAETGWERVPRSWRVRDVTVSKKDQAWAVGRKGRPYFWKKDEAKWSPLRGRLRGVESNCNGTTWGVTWGGGVFKYDIDAATWTKYGAGARQVSVGKDIYVRGVSNHIFQLYKKHNAWKWRKIGRGRRVAAGIDGTVWVLDRRGRVWIVNPGPSANPAASSSGSGSASSSDSGRDSGSDSGSSSGSGSAAADLPQDVDEWDQSPFSPGNEPDAKISRENLETGDPASVTAPDLANPEPTPVHIQQHPIVKTDAPETHWADDYAPNDHLKQHENVGGVNHADVIEDPITVRWS